jgi:hypothetical protein
VTVLNRTPAAMGPFAHPSDDTLRGGKIKKNLRRTKEVVLINPLVYPATAI